MSEQREREKRKVEKDMELCQEGEGWAQNLRRPLSLLPPLPVLLSLC